MLFTTHVEQSAQYSLWEAFKRLCTRVGNMWGTIALQCGRRWRQSRRLMKVDGACGIVDRFRAVAAERIAPKNAALPFFRSDILSADLSRPPVIRAPQLIRGQRPIVNWVTIPAGAKSGGNTTLFRIIRHLENNGYTNRVYFYNVFGADHSYYESIVRNFYDFHGVVAHLEDGMEDAHAVLATSWPTAYPVFNFQGTGKRFYFVQDFEPHFYPVGALSLLAENTYRMGFHAITVGQYCAEKLRAEFGMTADSVEFGCDTSRYRLIEHSRRSGVVFYAQRENARRGFELGLMALELFAARHPDIEIHIFGDKIGKLPFAFVDHGRVTPDQLNGIYNRCYAGLCLSFTNVSLVPYEMLAAGCLPVVNDAVPARMDIKSPFVTYSTASPHSLASTLEKLIMRPDFDSFSRAGAESVRLMTWDHVGASVASILQRALK